MMDMRFPAHYLSLALCCLIFFLLVSCGGRDNDSALKSPRGPSVARLWNETLLEAIRSDFARPTVHARNLFHISAAMYDAWAAYATIEKPYLLGADDSCSFSSLPVTENTQQAREQAISYAAYRMILHRFDRSPGVSSTLESASALMSTLGYDTSFTDTDYANGSAAALGNYIANCYISYGLGDGANEINEYGNTAYEPVNPVIEPAAAGNPNIIDLNRWQAISLEVFIDQAGNPVTSDPEFLSPEWGRVRPFALQAKDMTTYERDGFGYQVYHDPGLPPTIGGELDEQYKWNFALVLAWSSHLDPNSEHQLDISPAAIGNFNIDDFPRQFSDFGNFYRFVEGGDVSEGYQSNPVTGETYASQIVPRGDYARVLAEFWADGPESETPPGHWFVILNSVNDSPHLERRFGGVGVQLGLLEWDIKAYFTLGGAMHDAAISAWGVKGWYDYIRPISAIRAMADRGQSSSTELPSYAADGISLVPGLIEMVDADDPLVGESNENLNKIKVFAWRGPEFIDNPAEDIAGVGWILAENWWPYQRPSFVTPPFAGYVSGHSTYSRAAAEILTALTGSPFFPGGLGEFVIPADSFLVFERGPSIDIRLQWASFRDASDQCSLSRIWGGIHPPADDIPGRLIGEKVGQDAFAAAEALFAGKR